MTATSFSVVLFLPLLANAAPIPCETLAKFIFNDAAITLAQSVPGPDSVRQCSFRLATEYRPSGTVIVPQMHCWWERG